MPIYGKRISKQTWVLEKNLNKNKIIKLRVIFNRVAKEDPNGVQQSLVPNTDYSKPYLYSYDCHNSPTTYNNYSNDLEALINKANIALKKDKVFGKDYVFDIMGNWSMGDIVVMKRTSMQKSDYEKQIDRYQKVVDKKIKKISKIFF